MNLNYTWKPAADSAFRPGRGGSSVKSIILHSTDGRCSGDIQTLTGHDAHLVSVHWYVTRNGDIYHFVQDSDTAFHAGKVDRREHDNQHSVGVEHEHFDGSEDWPDAQIKASALLMTFLMQQYPDAEITHHSHVATETMYGRDYGRKLDPAEWPSDRFWQFVEDWKEQGEITAVQVQPAEA